MTTRFKGGVCSALHVIRGIAYTACPDRSHPYVTVTGVSYDHLPTYIKVIRRRYLVTPCAYVITLTGLTGEV